MILIVDDDKIILRTLSLTLQREGYETATAENPEQALDFVRHTEPDLVIMDMNFTGGTSGKEGLELLRKMRIFVPDTPIMLMSAWGTIPIAVEGMKLGAFDFITKPWHPELLKQRIANALAVNSKEEVGQKLSDFNRTGIIGESPAMTTLIDNLRRIAPTDVSVLITGENGTGKELIAKAIHDNSKRAGKPFVAVNLGGLPLSLFESEMFGHIKGAFTGAVADRKGRFEAADGGTIFLDEIGELDLTCQVKMLRVLQEHTLERLGDSKPRRVDMRVISATNADLTTMLSNHTFREDLFYRINTVTIHVPSLRERRSDIPMLVNYFARQLNPENSPEFSADAIQYLTQLPYPGNVRQLKGLVERAVILSGKRLIDRIDVEDAEKLSVAHAIDAGASTSGRSLEEIERLAITEAIERNAGNLSATAADLGITRQTLYRRMEKYGLK
ncbi:MAG: sigma-54 dependent transcriptional regulator [Lachnoclostridium sp.]|nr:sigma-54 dependent transcriptional regulator [Lachnoclostridium sp.]